MIFRDATIEDIEQIQIVRNLVTENVLSDPNLVTNEDCEVYITIRGKGWVCEIDSSIVGFAIADLIDNNIWALFVNPAFEKKGIGKQLHKIMLDWYFNHTQTTIWLSTDSNTRASIFYRKAGWQEVGLHGKNEIKFVMTFQMWQQLNSNTI